MDRENSCWIRIHRSPPEPPPEPIIVVCSRCNLSILDARSHDRRHAAFDSNARWRCMHCQLGFSKFDAFITHWKHHHSPPLPGLHHNDSSGDDDDDDTDGLMDLASSARTSTRSLPISTTTTTTTTAERSTNDNVPP